MPVQKKAKTAETKTTFHTGDKDFDSNRLNTKSFDDKPEKPIRGEFWAGVGDVIEGVGNIVINPNFGMILGYGAVGACFVASTVGYQKLFPSLGFLNIGLAAIVQYIQILPRMALYNPAHANRITLKLGLTRFLDPKVTEQSPTLLSEAKTWARNADKKLLKLVVTVSTVLYIVELLGQAKAFQVFDPKTMQLQPEGIFLLLAGTVGFELSLLFTNWMKSQRLTSRESRKYKEINQRQRIEAEQAFNLK